MTETRPTYTDAIQDAIGAVERLAARAERLGIDFNVAVVRSELRSLHPAANKIRDRTRAETAEKIVLQFARRIVAAGFDDMEFAEQRPEPSFGNLLASVQFTPVEVMRWARYAAARGDTAAAELLRRIDDDHRPVTVGV